MVLDLEKEKIKAVAEVLYSVGRRAPPVHKLDEEAEDSTSSLASSSGPHMRPSASNSKQNC